MSQPATGLPASRWRPALFGKLPSHGDFICRGLAEAERTAWDTWAAAGLVLAQDALGDGFDAAHSSAPAWKFVTGPGAFGTGWRAGAFAPSADKAGRRFLVVALFEDLSWGDAVAFGERLAAAQIDTIYRILIERLEADPAFAVVSGLTIEADPQAADVLSNLAAVGAQGVWWTAGGAAHMPAIYAGAALPADFLVRALTPSEASL